MRNARTILVCLYTASLFVLTGCGQAHASTPQKIQPSVTKTQVVKVATETPRPTFTKVSAKATSAPITPSVTPFPSGEDWAVLPGHFLFARPISSEFNDSVERSYPFGSTLNGDRDIHHGVEFMNPKGTPVLAAADGVVIAAGSDHELAYGNGTDFYGNLVVIEHNLEGYPEAIFTVYGHLSELMVQAGDRVTSGDQIGTVGKSGKAMGMHLHFEVRRGQGSYAEVVNPELWIKPHKGNGVLVGQILSPEGELRFTPGIKVQPITTAKKPPTYRPEPYADPNLNRDERFQEVFVVGDLPAGRYRVSFTPSSLLQVVDVEIVPGMVTRVVLHAKK